ncbi:MAG TPA: cation:proton antiporter [Rhodocyclaceae bacterium]|nr:cation:proton antiporter [Rhodocyclaceae bacterium]
MLHSLAPVLILFTAVVLAVALTRRAGLPSLLAYLAVGAALGPHALKVFPESETVTHLAEFGVVFLMFSIGLEFSLRQLRAMHRLVFGLGAAQVSMMLVGTVLATVYYYGQDWRIGVAVGAACAMSSTAIVAKLLSERFELNTPSGKQTMGVLLFQDMAVVPLLILIPALGATGGDLAREMGQALLVAIAVLLAVGLLGPRLMKKWFGAVSRTRSEELFMLSVLWIVIVLAGVTAWAGLSLALGAFLAGVLISETVFRHQVEADIRPFRDVLLGLFFITIGMQLDLLFVVRNLPAVLFALSLFICAKVAVMGVIGLVMRSPLDVTLRTAAQLAQAGEFGFVLLALGLERQLLPQDVFQVTMAAMLLSMFIAPFLIERAVHFSDRISKGSWMNDAKALHDVAVEAMSVRKHVILCGFGRSGQNVSSFLVRENIPFIALDLDEARIREAKRAGEHVVFGNAERREVLRAAGLARARAVVITCADTASAERVLHQVRQLRADLPVIVRAVDDRSVDRLKKLGATEVIPEVLEGSLMVAALTLSRLGVPEERTQTYLDEARSSHYAPLRELYGAEEEDAAEAGRLAAKGDAAPKA